MIEKIKSPAVRYSESGTERPPRGARALLQCSDFTRLTLRNRDCRKPTPTSVRVTE